jgi:hypothetical protein
MIACVIEVQWTYTCEVVADELANAVARITTTIIIVIEAMNGYTEYLFNGCFHKVDLAFTRC